TVPGMDRIEVSVNEAPQLNFVVFAIKGGEWANVLCLRLANGGNHIHRKQAAMLVECTLVGSGREYPLLNQRDLNPWRHILNSSDSIKNATDHQLAPPLEACEVL